MGVREGGHDGAPCLGRHASDVRLQGTVTRGDDHGAGGVLRPRRGISHPLSRPMPGKARAVRPASTIAPARSGGCRRRLMAASFRTPRGIPLVTGPSGAAGQPSSSFRFAACTWRKVSCSAIGGQPSFRSRKWANATIAADYGRNRGVAEAAMACPAQPRVHGTRRRGDQRDRDGMLGAVTDPASRTTSLNWMLPYGVGSTVGRRSCCPAARAPCCAGMAGRVLVYSTRDSFARRGGRDHCSVERTELRRVSLDRVGVGGRVRTVCRRG